MKRPASEALRGTAIAAASTAAAWALAEFGFRRPWYLGILLPAASLLALLLAWLLYLREDGLARGAEKGGGGAASSRGGAAPGAGSGRPEPPAPAGAPELGLFAPRDLLVERAPVPGSGREGAERDPRSARRALLWAAAETALLSIALYRLAGIGASFFE